MWLLGLSTYFPTDFCLCFSDQPPEPLFCFLKRYVCVLVHVCYKTSLVDQLLKMVFWFFSRFRLIMARGCICCVKYMLFLFNLLFWVQIPHFLI